MRMSIPLALTGLIQVVIPFLGTVFVAQLGTIELAAAGIVGATCAFTHNLFLGTLSAINILIAREYGARQFTTIAMIMRDSFLVGLLLTAICFFFFYYLPLLLEYLINRPTLIHPVSEYLSALIPGIPANIYLFILAEFYLGIGQPRVIFQVSIGYVLVNVSLSYCFIFGCWGISPMGIAGAGWAMSVSNWLTLLFLIGYSTVKYPSLLFGEWTNKTQLIYFFEILRVGTPLSAIHSIEASTLFIVNLLMGKISIIALGANQITLQFLSVVLAIIFSTAQAITIRIAHLIGGNHLYLIKSTAIIGFFCNTGLATVLSILFWYFPTTLIAFVNETNTSLIRLTTSFLLIGGVFQIIDAARIALLSILRSYKETFYPMLITLFCFWFASLPSGYFLSRTLDLGGEGLWWGLVIGNTLAVILLTPLVLSYLKESKLT